FCQTLPLQRLDALTTGLRAAGYRLLQFRPYADGAGVRAAAVWARDGREVRMLSGLRDTEVGPREEAMRRDGVQPLGFAGYLVAAGREERSAGLWLRAGPEEPDWRFKLLTGPVNDLTYAVLRNDAQAPRALQAFVDSRGMTRHCGVWGKGAFSRTTAWRAGF